MIMSSPNSLQRRQTGTEAKDKKERSARVASSEETDDDSRSSRSGMRLAVLDLVRR